MDVNPRPLSENVKNSGTTVKLAPAITGVNTYVWISSKFIDEKADAGGMTLSIIKAGMDQKVELAVFVPITN